jgi:hypothetical protein
MVDKTEQNQMLTYADELSKKVLNYKKNKKHHFTFLKNLNEMLAATLDNKDLAELEKELTNHYNNRLKANHKKKKDNPVKLNMKDDPLDDGDDYADDDDDFNNYTSFK